MEIQTDLFVIHDLTRFPLVWIKEGVSAPGYAEQWVREMDALVSIAQPFVLLHGTSLGDETHEDRKQRGLWLKHNKEPLKRYCKMMIGIESDLTKRLALKAQSLIATKAFGIPSDVAETIEGAEALAYRLLEEMPTPLAGGLYGH